jgi:hypothetical protein
MEQTSLNTIIDVNDLPEALNFVSGGLNALLSNMYVVDFHVYQDVGGHTLSYQLNLIVNKELSFNVPGTELKFLLNPDYTPGSGNPSSFPFQLSVTWPLLPFVKEFNIQNFGETAEEFKSIAKKTFPVEDDFLIRACIKAFISSSTPVQQFVNDANSRLSLSIPYDSNKTASENIEAAINYLKTTAQIPVWEVVMDAYVFYGNSSEYLENLNKFLAVLLVGETELPLNTKPTKVLLNYLLPQISASTWLEAWVEIPRSVLKPVDQSGEVATDTAIKSTIVLEAGEIYFDTSGRLEFGKDLSASLKSSYPKAMIGDTGIIVSFAGLKVDFSKNSNITEAKELPPDFVGVFAKQIDIELPAFWNHDDANSSGVIKGNNILVGTGGFSGTLALEAKNQGTPSPIVKINLGFEVELNTFSVTFQQNSIVGSDIRGKLTIPKFKKGNSPDPYVIDVDAAFDKNGHFTLTANTDNSIPVLTLPGIFSIEIGALSLGQRKNPNTEEIDFFVSVTGKLTLDGGTAISSIFDPEETVIPVKNLMIWEDGSIEIEGGSLPRYGRCRIHGPGQRPAIRCRLAA